MFTRKDLENCFRSHVNEALEFTLATMDGDEVMLAAIKQRRAERKAIMDSYLAAWDAAVDDDERYAIQCCVRIGYPHCCDAMAAKLADIKSGKIQKPVEETNA